MARTERPNNRERPEKPPPKPPPTYPPSTPEISFHLYGLNWDLAGGSAALAQQLRDALAVQFAPVLPGGSVDLAFRSDYGGPFGPISSLSLGVWSTPSPSAAAAKNARIAGLLAARTPGKASGSGEVSVGTNLIVTMISTAIHSRIANSDNTVTATLRSALVTELAPAGFTITASYDTDVPVLRPQPTCNSRVMFSGVGGSVQVNVAPVDCGDFGIVNSILLRFDAFPLGLTGLLALAYVAISNVGSGVPPLPDSRFHIGLGPTANDLFPREVPAGPLKFSLTYGSPLFSGGGGMQRSLRFPFTWAQPTPRMPTVAIRGPVAVTLSADETPPATTASFMAVTTDLVAPTFQWKLGTQAISGGAMMQITLKAPSLRPSAQRTFHITVTAVDGISNPIGPQQQATASIDVVGTVRHLPGFRD